MNKQELQLKANEVRKGIVTAVHAAKAGHPGGSLSAADIFTYLYFEELNIDPKDPKKPDRDRFVLSKGHTAPGLYSALALRGYFPVEDLKTLRHLGSYLFLRTGNFRSSRHGIVRQTFRGQLPCVYTARRWRDSGRTGMGSCHVCRIPQTG